MNWPWSKHRVRVKVIERQATKLRLSEWQADQSLCNQGSKVLSDPAVQLMIAVLHNEHPAFVVSETESMELRAVMQARCEGYTMALANLEALGQFNKLAEIPEATFEPEQLEPSTTK